MKKLFTLLAFIVCIYNSCFAQSSSTIIKVTNNFLSTLNEKEQEIVSFKFDDTLRTKWTNLPIGLAERTGIRYGDLSETSKIAFHDILTTIFSSQGYLKTTNIMHLDDYLLQIYEIAHQKNQVNEGTINMMRGLKWGHGNYYITIWGKPELERNWALTFGGHHISLNVTFIEGNISITPFFLGSDPALVTETQFAGMRPLSKEEDYGIEFINLLTQEQKNKAIISVDVPRDIITSPGAPQRLTSFQGIKASELTEDQKEQLKIIIIEYLGNFEREKAGYYLDKLLHNGVDNIYFGWIGGTKRATNHYYVINGPDFLIEYDNVGWVNQGDHIHTIFRDKKDDFGEDLLKTHYQNHKH